MNAVCKNRETEQEIWSLLEQVKDPEIPVLSLRELGVLRDVQLEDDSLLITITPTYSGCPAMDVMRDDIMRLLKTSGFTKVDIRTSLSPAWTTDWMSDTARSKLEEFGIAPPAHSSCKNQAIRCPRCATSNVALLSEYGSTACKSMYRCGECAETFCYFKQI